MKFTQVELKNFRCFENETFQFSPQFNILHGENGSGKTSLLLALAKGIGSFLFKIGIQTGLGNYEQYLIDTKDIRIDGVQINRIITFEQHFPTKILFYGKIIPPYKDNIQSITWEIESKNNIEKIVNYNKSEIFQDITENFQNSLQTGMKQSYPVFAYYSTSRLWGDNANTSSYSINNRKSRLVAYENCSNPVSNLPALIKWIQVQVGVKLQTGKKNIQFQAVKQAIVNSVENAVDLTYSFTDNQLMIFFENDVIKPFELLSDGQKNMVAMVADIAYRATVLNPHLDNPVTESEGVILIDEIDLHLHPRWQRTIVENLRRTFPNLQFIATTHSPFIIQSLKQGELIDMDGNDQPVEYENKSIEDITETVMGVELPQQSYRYQQMYETATQYYKLLENADTSNEDAIKQLKEKLDTLTAPFSDDPAYQAFLDMERIAKLGK